MKEDLQQVKDYLEAARERVQVLENVKDEWHGRGLGFVHDMVIAKARSIVKRYEAIVRIMTGDLQ